MIFPLNASILKMGLVMDATDLKVFEVVARHGSMNRAAVELSTVQSNVTARVSALEDELGVLLFQRHARGVKITPAGRRMLPFSARIARLLNGCRNAAELWRRLQMLGFRVSLRVVSEWTTRRRRAEKATDRQLQKEPSARTIARLITTARDHLSKADTVTIAALEARGPTLVEARTRVDRFQTMLRQKLVADLHLVDLPDPKAGPDTAVVKVASRDVAGG